MQRLVKGLLRPLTVAHNYVLRTTLRGPRFYLIVLQTIFLIAVVFYFAKITVDISWAGPRFSSQPPDPDTIYEVVRIHP